MARHPEGTLGVARAICLRLAADVPLWERGAEFRASDPGALAEALAEALAAV